VGVLKTLSPAQAAAQLRGGSVALVPTETVVGLVAAKPGFEMLWEIKGRDPNKPIALLCASAEEAFAMAVNVPPLAEKLAATFWPGPLTLVLDAPGGGTVGVRVPDHPAVAELLAAHGAPIYATSANLAGRPAPRTLEEVDPRVAAAVDFAVEGEPGDGEASSVVDLSEGKTALLRPGPVLDEAALGRLAGEGGASAPAV
jgi:L-threonylcarbamoyladenylate synthase